MKHSFYRINMFSIQSSNVSTSKKHISPKFDCSWCLTSTAATFRGSKPSHTSMPRESPTARSTRTASVCVIPSRLWLFTSRIRMPTCSRPSLAAAPVELTCFEYQQVEVQVVDYNWGYITIIAIHALSLEYIMLMSS